LREPRLAEIVEDALLHFDGDRYRLLAWCVMPNHVHAVAEMAGTRSLGDVVQGWKSYSAMAINRHLGRSGAFRQREYYDRFVRDDRHLASVIDYVEQNPVAAGLVERPEDWIWSSASRRAERQP
jgi:REP element-mobilizing transposase RayT